MLQTFFLEVIYFHTCCTVGDLDRAPPRSKFFSGDGGGPELGQRGGYELVLAISDWSTVIGEELAGL